MNNRDPLFFREWIYVEDVWYDGQGIGIQMNVDARVRGPFVLSIFVRDASIENGAIWEPARHEVTFPPDGFTIAIPRQIQQTTIETKIRLDGHLAYHNVLTRPSFSTIF